MSTQIEINNIIKGLKSMPDQVQKELEPLAEDVKNTIAMRAFQEGKDVKGNVMRYAKSTQAFKKRTQRDHTKKKLAHEAARIHLAHGVKKVDDSTFIIGFPGNSEANKLAIQNQSRQAFHGAGRREEKAVDNRLKNTVKGLKI